MYHPDSLSSPIKVTQKLLWWKISKDWGVLFNMEKFLLFFTGRVYVINSTDMKTGVVILVHFILLFEVLHTTWYAWLYIYESVCEHAVYKPTSYSALLIITCTRQITSSMFKIQHTIGYCHSEKRNTGQ